MTTTILQGNVLDTLQQIESGLVRCVVTSPPYYGLRSYLKADDPLKVHEIGTEATPELYIDKLVSVFREVWRTMSDDGTLWLNIGDSYAGSGKGGQSEEKRSKNWQPEYANKGMAYGLKAKDLCMIPARVAIALQRDGWYLRSEIVWAKRNCMPESVKDRPTRSHEMIYLLTKSVKYYYDNEAIKTPTKGPEHDKRARVSRKRFPTDKVNGIRKTGYYPTANARDVWHIATKPYPEAHFAVFPPDLIEPCILAGSAVGDTVLDPFGGSGTTAMVATKHNRNAVLCELNQEYIPLINQRVGIIQPKLEMIP